MFGAGKLTKHPDIDHYKYSGYGIGFDRKGFFSLGNEIGRNVIIFGVDISSSSHIDNKKKDILIHGKGPTQGLEHTLATEKLYSINFTKHHTKFCLSLHYNEANSYLFFNGVEIIKLLNCSIYLVFRKHFKRLVSRQYEKDWSKWIYL